MMLLINAIGRGIQVTSLHKGDGFISSNRSEPMTIPQLKKNFWAINDFGLSLKKNKSILFR